MSTSVPNFQLTPEAFRQCTELLPDAMLLVSVPDGFVWVANKKARETIGHCAEPGCLLSSLVDNATMQLDMWLKMARRSKQPIPTALMLKKSAGIVEKCLFEASLLQPASNGEPAYVLLRADMHQKDSMFSVLTQEIDKQKHSLEQLQQAQKALERKNEELHSSNQQLETEMHERLRTENANKQLLAENVRMSAELSITRQLQKMVLPREDELLKIKSLDISCFMEPANEVGGDYYDVLQYQGRVKIGIGDVTGHGLASGVLMLMVQTAVRTLLVSKIEDPKQFLEILNRAIYENVQRMESDKNLTLSLLDYKDGHLTLCGQHEEVLVVRNNSIERIDTIDLGFMVGLEPDISAFLMYQEIDLCPGDGIILYTDGLTEARNPDKEMYSLERLCEVVHQYWNQSAYDIQTAVITDLKAHIKDVKLKDDVTLLVIKQIDIQKVDRE